MTTENNSLSVIQSSAKRLDELAESHGNALATSSSPFSNALTLASAIVQIRDLLTEDMMKPIMQLMNSPLGFLTDRTGKPNWKGETKPLYTWEQVRECMIEATLRGFAPVGNEWNIIAERFYGAKSGFRRKVQNFPGLSNFKDTYEVPEMSDASALVKCKAQWSLRGSPDFLEREFYVKGDKYATADSYCGKAERKLLAAVFQRVSGVYIPEGDSSDFVEIPAQEKSDAAKPAIIVETKEEAKEETSRPETEVLTEWRGVVKVEMKSAPQKGKADAQWGEIMVGENKCITIDSAILGAAINAETSGKEHIAFVRQGKKTMELVSVEVAK